MPGIVKPPQTLYDKVFRDHIVDEKDDGTILLYIGELHTGNLGGYISNISNNLSRQTPCSRSDITCMCWPAHVTLHEAPYSQTLSKHSKV